MTMWIKTAHPLFSLVLFFLYLALAVRLKRQNDLKPLDTALAQAARLLLLLIYLTGLIMSMNLGIWVPSRHHYASLLPVFILLIFQVLPSFFGRGVNIQNAVWMFASMAAAIVIISFFAL
jgi:hypothetical protein